MGEYRRKKNIHLKLRLPIIISFERKTKKKTCFLDSGPLGRINFFSSPSSYLRLSFTSRVRESNNLRLSLLLIFPQEFGGASSSERSQRAQRQSSETDGL